MHTIPSQKINSVVNISKKRQQISWLTKNYSDSTHHPPGSTLKKSL